MYYSNKSSGAFALGGLTATDVQSPFTIGEFLGGLGGGGSSTGGSGGGGIIGVANSIISKLSGLWNAIRCINSTWTPKRAEAFVKNHIRNYGNRIENVLQNANENSIQAINDVLLAYYKDYQGERYWITTNNPKKCSRDSIKSMLPPLDEFNSQMVAYCIEKLAEVDVKVTASTIAFERHNNTWYAPSIKLVENMSIIDLPNVKYMRSGSLGWLVLIPTPLYWA